MINLTKNAEPWNLAPSAKNLAHPEINSWLRHWAPCTACNNHVEYDICSFLTIFTLSLSILYSSVVRFFFTEDSSRWNSKPPQGAFLRYLDVIMKRSRKRKNICMLFVLYFKFKMCFTNNMEVFKKETLYLGDLKFNPITYYNYIFYKLKLICHSIKF